MKLSSGTLELVIEGDVYRISYDGDNEVDDIQYFKDGKKGYVVNGDLASLPEAAYWAMKAHYAQMIEVAIAESRESQREREEDEQREEFYDEQRHQFMAKHGNA